MYLSVIFLCRHVGWLPLHFFFSFSCMMSRRGWDGRTPQHSEVVHSFTHFLLMHYFLFFFVVRYVRRALQQPLELGSG